MKKGIVEFNSSMKSMERPSDSVVERFPKHVVATHTNPKPTHTENANESGVRSGVTYSVEVNLLD